MPSTKKPPSEKHPMATLGDGALQTSPGETNAGGKVLHPCHATALRKATRRLSQLYDAALAPCGLRSTQRSILRHIHDAGELTMGDLADILVLDRSALNHNLKPLERDGLVQVRVALKDKRSRRVRLTPAGREKLAASQPLWREAQRRFEAIIPVGQTTELISILAEISSPEFAETFIASPGVNRA
ncbi:MarR family winged helix-turn-helix transcriptional regulator [Sodalis sp. dw_96]|uniref:MarR family winged helix-turn-helix transcriptional regulator n=1 Tax=Sodalis sp. dw_96 TaxID=2719794 RepID=UPI001BD1BE07|nr:MarR family winged helix-turn-helix transcriptional regulator [Sodalis sp. dw_96]